MLKYRRVSVEMFHLLPKKMADSRPDPLMGTRGIASVAVLGFAGSLFVVPSSETRRVISDRRQHRNLCGVQLAALDVKPTSERVL